MARNHPWLQAEITTIIRTYPTHTAREQARMLRRSLGSVEHKRSDLIRAGRLDPSQRAYCAEWTADDEQTMLEMLHDGHPTSKIARKLGRSREAVDQRILKLGHTIQGTRQARSVAAVAQLFGVTHTTILKVWIPRGWLTPFIDRRTAKERSRDRRAKTAIRRPKMLVTDDHIAEFMANRLTWPYWDPRRIEDRDWRETAEELRAAAGGHWLSCQEVGRRYSYSEGMVQGWIRAGALKATRITNAYFVWSTDLEGWTPPSNAGLWAGRKKSKEAA